MRRQTTRHFWKGFAPFAHPQHSPACGTHSTNAQRCSNSSSSLDGDSATPHGHTGRNHTSQSDVNKGVVRVSVCTYVCVRGCVCMCVRVCVSSVRRCTYFSLRGRGTVSNTSGSGLGGRATICRGCRFCGLCRPLAVGLGGGGGSGTFGYTARSASAITAAVFIFPCSSSLYGAACGNE